jgi:ankyrin repeat protein
LINVRKRGLSTLLGFMVLTTGCSSLLSATRAGDAPAVQNLLAKGTDPNAHSEDEPTPLCEAIAQDDVRIARMLITAGAEMNLVCNLEAPYDSTPLELAVQKGNEAIFKHLLVSGADPFTQSGPNPLLNILPNVLNSSPLVAGRITQVYLEHVERVYGRERMLRVATQSAEGWTPLALAAYGGQDSMIRRLVERGVDPNGRSPAAVLARQSTDQWPPIYFAYMGRLYAGRNDGAERALVDVGANAEGSTEQDMSLAEASAAVMASRAQQFEEASRLAAETERAERLERRESEANAQAAWQSFSSAMTAPASSQPYSSTGSGSPGVAPNPEPSTQWSGRIIIAETPPPAPLPPSPAARPAPPAPAAGESPTKRVVPCASGHHCVTKQ